MLICPLGGEESNPWWR